MTDNIENLFQQHIDFCNDAFPESTEVSCLHHAVEEICEIWKEKDESKKPEEYVDAIMCELHGLNRAGISIQQFKDAFIKKLEKNKKRKWIQNNDGSYSHKKTPVPFGIALLKAKQNYNPNANDDNILF